LPQLDLKQQYSTLNNSTDARDPLDALAFNGHGTATASVMISGKTGEVLGISPQATVLPIRCVRSVVLISGGDVARAIWHACVCGAEVVSLSIGGGLPLPSIEAVLAYAVREREMIVCAAAGNLTWWVAYPAAYPDCIAVGGCNVRDAPYAKGSYGPEVDICAPAAGVWVGDFDSKKAPVPISPGWGTSFSAPHVAGAAALWLEQVRGNTDESPADHPPLQEMFREVLRRTARVPVSGWDRERHGAGILDVSALLQNPLPDRLRVVAGTPWRRTTWATVLENGFSLPPGSASERAATLLGADSSPPGQFVERFGPELVQLGLTDDERYSLMLAAFEVASPIGHEETWSGQVDIASLRDQFRGWIRQAGSTSLNEALDSP
jgi:subtilisin family serine protease